MQGFLASLELQVDVASMQPFDIERVAELTQRTNQFNVTTIRRSAQEVRSFATVDEPMARSSLTLERRFGVIRDLCDGDSSSQIEKTVLFFSAALRLRFASRDKDASIDLLVAATLDECEFRKG